METYTGEWQSSPIKIHAYNLLPVKGEFRKQVSHLILENECSFTWNIDIPESNEYAVIIVYSTNAEGNISFEVNGSHAFSQTLPETKGLVYPYAGEWHQINFVRKTTGGKLSLEKGAQEITVKVSPGENGSNFLIHTFELIPATDSEKIIAETERIVLQRADASWLASVPYGLMFHWTSEASPQKGKPLPFADAVRNFDVTQFANMVQEAGAGYVIFTIGHAEAYCPAPIQSWEQYHPGTTTNRDLIAEIADELAKRDIKLITYFAVHVFAQHLDSKEFMRVSTDILNEIGQRYGEKIAGYWFDGWYQCIEEHPDLSMDSFYTAAKTGNPGRIIALNTWTYPAFTQRQDYWAGETYSDCSAPSSRIIKEGPGAGLPFQALLALEGDWVYARSQYPDDKPIPAPVLDIQYMTNLVKSCKGKGPVTFNLLIYQDGTVSEQSMQFIRQLKKNIAQ
ncbi:MAG: alpha-L-fucosidase [Tannerella sp.]|nr:alpha-L-fucosidase [Tannerella sp.]